MDKGSGSGIFPDPDPDPGDPKRPDPTGCAKLLNTVQWIGDVIPKEKKRK